MNRASPEDLSRATEELEKRWDIGWRLLSPDNSPYRHCPTWKALVGGVGFVAVVEWRKRHQQVEYRWLIDACSSGGALSWSGKFSAELDYSVVTEMRDHFESTSRAVQALDYHRRMERLRVVCDDLMAIMREAGTTLDATIAKDYISTHLLGVLGIFVERGFAFDASDKHGLVEMLEEEGLAVSTTRLVNLRERMSSQGTDHDWAYEDMIDAVLDEAMGGEGGSLVDAQDVLVDRLVAQREVVRVDEIADLRDTIHCTGWDRHEDEKAFILEQLDRLMQGGEKGDA